MNDFEIRYIEIALENRKLETTVVNQSIKIRELCDKILDLRKIISEISMFCPLAVGNYDYLFDDSEDCYD